MQARSRDNRRRCKESHKKKNSGLGDKLKAQETPYVGEISEAKEKKTSMLLRDAFSLLGQLAMTTVESRW